MNFAEHLKSQLNIVDVVGQYVRLKRQGAGPRYVGLCPFHSEKTPSFGVHSALGYYKCFGCDSAGDVFKFIQQIENLTFPETLKLLAERYGIPMPERERSNDPEAQRRAVLLEMHEIAAEIFQSNLRGAGGADTRRYLESRGVSRAAMDEFRLGLSDASGQQLVNRLQKFGAAAMEESGLVGKRQDGGFYDRFRGRLMFPIHSESGKVIAFGGRALRAGDEPKYLNSPETKLYKKSTVLYNLHRAKVDARKNNQIILVEGYMDVIGVYSAGIHEVVASSGTSLGIEQVRAAKRQISAQQANTGQVFLNFDSDPAGGRSTEKYIAPFLAEGLRVKVLEIPGGFDPDEYIQQNGAEAYRTLIAQAPSYFHWLADRARNKFDARTAEGRVDAFKFIAPVLEMVTDRIERSAIASEVAEYLKADRSVVNEVLRKRTAAQQGSRKARDLNSGIAPNEKLLVHCLLASADARMAIQHFLAGSELLPLLELREIFEAAMALDAEGVPFELEALSQHLTERPRRILADLAFADTALREEGAAEQALSCLKALEAKAIVAKQEELRGRIRDLEREGKVAEALRVAEELNRVNRRSAGV